MEVPCLALRVSGWAAWRLYARHAVGSGSGLLRLSIGLIGVIGAGSLTFHTIATHWAAWLNIVPILAIMLVYLWLLLTRFIGWSATASAIALLAFFALTFTIERVVPVTFLAGGAMYLPAVAVLLGFALIFHLRLRPTADRAFGLATLVFLASYTARTLDAPLCDNWLLGTHFLWHLLNALLLYQLVRFAVLHDPHARNLT